MAATLPSELSISHSTHDALPRCLLAITRFRVPSKSALISAMKASSLLASSHDGRAVHARVVKAGLGTDRFVASSVIRFYSSCSDLDSARKAFDGVLVKDVALQTALLIGYAQNGEITQARALFDGVMEKDVVAWNAMLSAYTHCGLPQDALQLFREMQMSNCRPNEVTLIGALSACSQIGCLALGEWIHGYLRRHPEVRRTTTLNNSLVHLYAKCGKINAALDTFLEHGSRDLESWNTMLTGFAINGCGTSALSLFSQMMKLGVRPDRISFVEVLMACSHVGMVDDARRCLDCMTRFYGIEPSAEHYGCLVDVLSRGGHLDEARSLLESMPCEADASAWGALLGGCFAHGKYELGIEAAVHLIQLQPLDEGRYVALQNLYAMVGRTEDALRVRKVMCDMGIRRSSGTKVGVGGRLMRWASVRRAGNAKEEPAPERIRCLAAAREHWSRFYSVTRCVLMLICWLRQGKQ
ncbi:hypothetical protein C4D60_Mb02t05530 [Musa balbisiana]|uniref:Pentacotripeptide-repeat region of PRORP domain-containing protein n=1 Tax=Musa balbisiana TaxID=52838 RepID=A0A4S8I8G8_MUSBA|nr:hypothetical protein C4D60_Mb02t05530 [Musa balbisiana]